jgi:acyl-CoA synthetase (NDP forming)
VVLLPYDQVSKALEAAGISIARERLVDNAEQAVAFASEVQGPVVLKLSSPALVHKSDVGAVQLGVVGDDAVRTAAERLIRLADELGLEHAGWRILVQEQIESTTAEIYIGLKRDPVFGPVIVVGGGGNFVELFSERAVARCPLTFDQSLHLLDGTSLGTALAGYRGKRDVLPELAAMLSSASALLDIVDGLDEVDLNPVVIDERGPRVVDARMVVSDSHPSGRGGGSPRATGVDGPPVTHDLSALLEPESVLVIGASASGALMPGNRVLRYLKKHGYSGRVTVIHPSATEIDGYPAVARITDLSAGSVDLACVAVSAATCVSVVEQCGLIGVRAAVVFSSGFSEVGNHELERELADAAVRNGIQLCGPNTVGTMSPAKHVHMCFSQAQDMARPLGGSVGLVVQSGALGGSIASQAWQHGIGISRFISVGNQAVLGTADYLRYLATDDDTQTVAVLLEGVDDGVDLLDAIKLVRTAGKSIYVLKIGRTAVGARAVQTHTGSIAGNYTVYRALLQASGAVPLDSLTELLDVLRVESGPRKLPSGARIAVVSTSGGACSMMADLCIQQGFEVPVLGDEVQSKLRQLLPGFAATANPIDVTGHVATDPEIYGKALDVILKSDAIDAVAIMITTIADPQGEQIAEEVVRQLAVTDKPVIVSWTIADELAPRGLQVFADAGIAVFEDPARALYAMGFVSGARS